MAQPEVAAMEEDEVRRTGNKQQPNVGGSSSGGGAENKGRTTPSMYPSPARLVLLGTPIRRAVSSMRGYLEEIGHIARLNPHDAWLPITESRSGNAYYAAFHTLNAGIGFQALLLPLAFASLGWCWGIVSLLLAFAWQLYTLWILTRLHEATPGLRYNRYVELAQAAFGDRWGSRLTSFPVISLSAGTAGGLAVVGGSTLRLFHASLCDAVGGCSRSGSLTTVEWYLVFAVLCAIIAQLPNLNSIACLSLLGGAMAVAYTTLVWAISVSQPRPPGVSYDVLGVSNWPPGGGATAVAFSTLNALGIVAFAFRGHNLALEIQATMPSSLKRPSRVPMWRGTVAAYAAVAACYVPIAVGGYWAYGKQILPSGVLVTMYAFHRSSIPPAWLAITFLFVVLSSLASFQIYAMPTFDAVEQAYAERKNRPFPPLHRAVFRSLFAFTGFLLGVAFPFMASFGGLLGGLCSVPVTFCYPCFMWLRITRPRRWGPSWCLNIFLGWLAIALTLVFTTGGVWSIIDSGLKLKFFKPQ